MKNIEDNILQENIIIGIVIGLLVIFFAFLIKEIIRIIFLKIHEILILFDVYLNNYYEKLEKDTLKIHHSWMKEGQNLKDILISVKIVSKKSSKTENIDDFLRKQFLSFDEKKPPRILLLGAPGSGKTVALSIAAQESRDIYKQTKHKKIIPIIIRFTDFKNTGYDLEKAIIESLKDRKFLKNNVLKIYDATEFVKKNLFKGNILVLIDAFDELDINDRKKAAINLKKYFKNTSIPAIISCRSNVYKKQLESIISLKVEMVDLSPIEMKLFLQKWKFDPPKNSTDLWLSIRDKPHIMKLAKNPLLLTIITYVYSKYDGGRLPENRARFYEICCNELLDEWEEDSQRKNKFSRFNKEKILGRLAYTHLTSNDPDKDIDYRKLLEYFSLWMNEMGLNRSENEDMLNEIIDNSGLLINIPPDDLRFPHQTFLEYFAALYFIRESSPEELINKYKTDSQRWREVILLYVGLTKEEKNSFEIINYLYKNDEIQFTINSMSDSRIFNYELSNKIIDCAENTIKTNPSIELIRNLGILSSNTDFEFRDKVNQILLNMLHSHKNLSDYLLQEIIISLIKVPTEESIQIIIENYKRLNLKKIFLNLTKNEFLILNQLISLKELPSEKKLELIEGLRLSDKPDLLINLMISSEDTIIKINSASALAKLSNGIDFWDFINSKNLPQISNKNVIQNIEKHFGWPFDEPYNIEGKRILYYITYYYKEGIIHPTENRIHPRIAYLINIVHGKNYMKYFVWKNFNKKWFNHLMYISPKIKNLNLYIYFTFIGLYSLTCIYFYLFIEEDIIFVNELSLGFMLVIIFAFVHPFHFLVMISINKLLKRIMYLDDFIY